MGRTLSPEGYPCGHGWFAIRNCQRLDGFVRIQPARIRNNPETRTFEGLWLLSRDRLGATEGGSVRRDSGDGYNLRSVLGHEVSQLLAADTKLFGRQLRCLRCRSMHDVGDSDPTLDQMAAVAVTHAGAAVNDSFDYSTKSQRRIEAIAWMREVGACGRGPKTWIDADEEQPKSRPDKIGHGGVAIRLEFRPAEPQELRGRSR